ncbi:dihydrofolate reductase family protein [Maliponia aquimaris]|uniref:Bacterial bifunctional deaminase-reductase C-terminal domain-containing protein n=1 Tax=Maliponia aquimaris TaxID=1673631 RepID=A0A238L5Y4_9RHOB|nr:dihydrofolate reductase family protein [Maliponia aquimaris]SMX50221.1 hypothetical protein MAA8898_04669 [Maliponia aquimaris]
MTTGHVFIAMSLDGYIAREDDRLDWLTQRDAAGEDHGYDAFIAGIDGLVMGSGTFRTVLGYGGDWPYAKPVVVLSHSLTDSDIPEDLRGRDQLSRLDPAALMQDLAARGWRRAYVDGGRVIRAFLARGLIADMQVTLVPVLIGRGRPLFGGMDLEDDIGLTVQGVRQFPSGLLTVRYSVSASRPGKDT